MRPMTPAPRLPLCFLIVLLVIGIPAWGLPYDPDLSQHPELLPGAILLGVLPLWLTVTRSGAARRIFGVMSLCVPLVDVILIVRDTAIDPTNHNLWPFELFFTWIIGAGIIFPGVLIGILLRMGMSRG